MRVPKQPHYDDAEKIKNWIESNFSGWTINILPAYKKPEGGYTTYPGEHNINPPETNVRIIHAMPPSFSDATIVNTDNPGSGLLTRSLIPYLSKFENMAIEFICVRADEATLDIDINGGEFTISAFGLQYSELLASEEARG